MTTTDRRQNVSQIRLQLLLLENRTTPASFQGLGFLPGDTSSQAIGISPDGTVIVGQSDGSSGTQAFRWTATAGMVGLGKLGPSYSSAGGVSADGSVVVGGSHNQPFRWTATTGMVGIGGTGNSSYAGATSVSADGGVIVGAMGNPPQAFRWTESSGMVALGHIPGLTEFSLATSITPDGSTVVGWSQGGGLYETFRWTESTGMIGLGTLGSTASSAYAISAEGSTIVGDDGYMPTQKGYRWTASTGMVDLGHLPGPNTETQSYGVSGDGSVVVGHSAGQAFYWTHSEGMQSLQTILMSDYGLTNELDGWSLSAAYKCSTDGLTIIGWGTNPYGQLEAWVAQLEPAVPPVPPSTLSGLVWDDFNDDGAVNSGEQGISGIAITLTGTNDLGDSVSQTVNTDTNGFYEFVILRPGTYSLSETQPAGYVDGREMIGTVNGLSSGNATVNDLFSQIILPTTGGDGINYNFGELPASGIHPDPSDATKTALVVHGTVGDDELLFRPAGNNGGISVILNGVQLGIYHPTGRIIAYGGTGNDDIRVTESIHLPAYLFGQGGDDSIKGGGRNDVLDGGADNDDLVARGGNDTLFGGDGDDSLRAGSGNDMLFGCDDDDTLQGGDGYDTLNGGNGHDLITGGAGAETMNGGAGNDTLIAGTGTDRIFGDDGDDLLIGGTGNDYLDGGAENDEIIGGNGDDVLIGGTGYADTLSGGAGHDWLGDVDGVASASGGNGDDQILLTFANGWNIAGSMALLGDAISGGNGNDVVEIATNNAAMQIDLYGDGGNDQFILHGVWQKIRVYGGTGIDLVAVDGVGLLELFNVEVGP